MYMFFLFLLLSNFTVVFAMHDVKKFPYHEIVRRVSEEGIGQEAAQKELKMLWKNKENRDPNTLCNYRTAAVLSAFYCISEVYFCTDQLAVLEFLLKKDSAENRSINVKTITDDLTQSRSQLNTYLKHLRQRPFTVSEVDGGGAVITSDDGDEEEENIQKKLDRIEKVEKIVNSFDLKKEELLMS